MTKGQTAMVAAMNYETTLVNSTETKSAPAGRGRPDTGIRKTAKRRNMTKGQTAMVGAMSYISNDVTGSRKEGRQERGVGLAAKAVGVSQATMTKAFAVRDHAPDLAPAVIAGTMTPARNAA